MIISHKLKCIFVAIPKTATHAIRFSLRKYMDEGTDWEQVGLFVKKSLPIDEIAKVEHGHITCREIQPFLDSALWESYFKFAVVRNPYDRFVSFCAFINRADLNFAKQPLPKMKQTIEDKAVQQRILFRPQYEFVTDVDKNLLVDFVGRYEQLQEAYNQVCTQLNIPNTKLTKINRSIHKPFAEYYDEELRQAVFAFYRQDFELFGYAESLDESLSS